jgi:hypothetical protein
MKLHSHSNNLQTNVEGRTKNFGIGNASKIIGILRDKLYEHKIRTLVQEYISNGRDSCREAGQPDSAMEITVPTRLNPVFKVRDYGTGLSPEAVENVFIMYGTSTKEHTNELTGGLGIGSKSAWSYTDSYTIVSFLDGVKRTYVAHTGVNNEGRLDLLSEDSTDEKNGVEIQIAVNPGDVQEFRSAVYRAIYFWENKPTLKGDLTPPTLTKGEVISDLLEIIDSSLLPEYIRTYGSSEIVASIDGIPYVINDRLIDKVKPLKELVNLSHKRVVLHFGNGLVEVAASREAIADSKHTLHALEKLGQKALLEAKTAITKAFGEVNSATEYLKTYAHMSQYFNVDSFAKYEHYSIQHDSICSKVLDKVIVTKCHRFGSRRRWTTSNKIEKVTKDSAYHSIEVKYFDNVFFVSKDEGKIVTSRKIKEYLKTHDCLILLEVLTSHTIVNDANGKPTLDANNKAITTSTSHTKEYNKVINELSAKDFTALPYTPPAKTTQPFALRQRNSGMCLHGASGHNEHTTLAKNTQKWIYVELDGSTWPKSRNRSLMYGLQDYTETHEGYKVCAVSSKYVKALKKDANFISLNDWMKGLVPSKDLLIAVKDLVSKNRDAYENLKPAKGIEDQFLVDMISEYKTFDKRKVCHVGEFLLAELQLHKEINDFKYRDEKFAKAMTSRYPLFSHLRFYGDDPVEYLVDYINLMNKSLKGKKYV